MTICIRICAYLGYLVRLASDAQLLKVRKEMQVFQWEHNFREILLLSGSSITETLNLVNLMNRVFYFHLSDTYIISCLWLSQESGNFPCGPVQFLFTYYHFRNIHMFHSNYMIVGPYLLNSAQDYFQKNTSKQTVTIKIASLITFCKAI